MSLQSLASMAHVLSRSHDVRDVIETAATDARAALGAATVSIGQVDLGADVVRTVINVGDLSPVEVRWPEDEVYVISSDERLMSAMHELRSWVDSIDDPACSPRERMLLDQLGKGSSLVTPIVVDGQAWGEFYATRHIGTSPFDDDAIAYAEVVAAIMAAAISRTLREAELKTLASHDALTGVYNRRGLDDRVTEFFELGDALRREIVAVAVDINELKLINDTQGHLFGDEQIRSVAAALTGRFAPMPHSVVARVGGDEFTVVVADTTELAVEQAINDVCTEMSERDHPVGISAGIASTVLTDDLVTATSSERWASDLFASADEALYVAKRTESRVAVRAVDISVA
jgi:diguanylate cyclase (GGDEF)-like protein